MKKIAFAVALVACGTGAFAGGLGEPVMEPEVVEAQASSSGGVLVPLLILLLVAVAIASSGGGDAPTPPIDIN